MGIQYYVVWRKPYLTQAQAYRFGFIGFSYWFPVYFFFVVYSEGIREVMLIYTMPALVYLLTFASSIQIFLSFVIVNLTYFAGILVGRALLGSPIFWEREIFYSGIFFIVAFVFSILGGSLKKQRAQASEAKRKQLRQAQDLMIQSEKLASMGQMVASIGHEISNPIMAAQSATSVMEDNLTELESVSLGLFEGCEEDPEAQKVRDEMIQQFGALRSGIAISVQAASKLKELSHALRTQSRMDTSVTENVNINDVIRESLTMVSGRAGLHTIEESLEEMPGIPCMRSRIGQVITNLLANASDALTEKAESSEGRFDGKIAISASPAERDGAEGITVVITDNGTGVPEEIREKIFDEFFTTKPAGVGTGLGLSMCATIVRDHGGMLEVTDDPTLGGARFAVWLPRSTPEQLQNLH